MLYASAAEVSVRSSVFENASLAGVFATQHAQDQTLRPAGYQPAQCTYTRARTS